MYHLYVLCPDLTDPNAVPIPFCILHREEGVWIYNGDLTLHPISGALLESLDCKADTEQAFAIMSRYHSPYLSIYFQEESPELDEEVWNQMRPSSKSQTCTGP